MKKIILVQLIILLIGFNACLHDRDNPNDPGAKNNNVTGEPVFKVRYNNIDITNEFELNIGSVELSDSQDYIFYVDNPGSAYLHLTGIEITNSSVFTAPAGPITPVSPGSSTSFTLRFTPEEAEEYRITVYIHYWEDDVEKDFLFVVVGSGTD